MMDVRNFRKLLGKLREHIASDQVDSRSKGLLSNILGELKELEKDTRVEVEQANSEAVRIIRLWKEDPVIQAYLQQKESLESEIRNLESMVPNLLAVQGPIPWDPLE